MLTSFRGAGAGGKRARIRAQPSLDQLHRRLASGGGARVVVARTSRGRVPADRGNGPATAGSRRDVPALPFAGRPRHHRDRGQHAQRCRSGPGSTGSSSCRCRKNIWAVRWTTSWTPANVSGRRSAAGAAPDLLATTTRVLSGWKNTPKAWSPEIPRHRVAVAGYQGDRAAIAPTSSPDVRGWSRSRPPRRSTMRDNRIAGGLLQATGRISISRCGFGDGNGRTSAAGGVHVPLGSAGSHRASLSNPTTRPANTTANSTGSANAGRGDPLSSCATRCREQVRRARAMPYGGRIQLAIAWEHLVTVPRRTAYGRQRQTQAWCSHSRGRASVTEVEDPRTHARTRAGATPPRPPKP